MSSPKPLPKSILKQVNTNANNSWFSKLNSDTNTTTPPISPRINSLFNSFRKQVQPPPLPPRVPQQSDNANNEIIAELAPAGMKRVRFPVTEMTIEYQFKRDDLVEEKKEIAMEPINIQTCAQLLSLYETICRKKQEQTIDLLVLTLINQPHATFLTRLDLTNQPLDRYNIEPLVDIMGIEFGMRELVLSNCGLEDDATKVLMHSLLENDKMTHVSLANNPKLTSVGFKYIAIYIKGSSQLTNLDLSFTQPDKKSIQYITSATTITEKSKLSLKTLLLNNCGLRNAQIEVLAVGMRKSSSIRHLYLRGNRFINGGALSIGVMLRDYDSSLQSLEGLYLDNNDLSQGIQYIAQALRRNQSLLTLSMCDCKIDAKGCVLIGEALKYNQHLERFDIGYNPICSPNMDGITLLRQALSINRSLKDLRLADTDMGTEAAIALAESLPENNSLVRLDLSRNPHIEIAGLMAFSVSIRMNHTITFIDINIPTDDKDMVEIHNGILATCTRNAQAKTNVTANQHVTPDIVSNPLVTTTQATARLTLQERLAAVTKGKNNRAMSTSSSEVTLTLQAPSQTVKGAINEEDVKLTQQAFDCVGSLEDVLSNNGNFDSDVANSILSNCKQVQSTICSRIPSISDSSQLEILLAINDRLATAIQKYETDHPIIKAVEAIDIKNVDDREKDKDDTLSSSFEIGDDDDDDEEEEYDEERENHLKELRSEIEAEESAAFLKAKQIEMDQKEEDAIIATV